jgi:valyl-tRNA synthetase
MSKSRGNVITPNHLLEQYSSDAVRYWAARARLGVDTAYDEGVFGNGKRLGSSCSMPPSSSQVIS